MPSASCGSIILCALTVAAMSVAKTYATFIGIALLATWTWRAGVARRPWLRPAPARIRLAPVETRAPVQAGEALHFLAALVAEGGEPLRQMSRSQLDTALDLDAVTPLGVAVRNDRTAVHAVIAGPAAGRARAGATTQRGCE